MNLLVQLCANEGYRFEWDRKAPDHPDALGLPQRDELCAQACKGRVIRMNPELDAPFEAQVYAVSHEIAEDRCGFSGHHQLLWREQLNILCRFTRTLATELQEAEWSAMGEDL